MVVTVRVNQPPRSCSVIPAWGAENRSTETADDGNGNLRPSAAQNDARSCECGMSQATRRNEYLGNVDSSGQE